MHRGYPERGSRATPSEHDATHAAPSLSIGVAALGQLAWPLPGVVPVRQLRWRLIASLVSLAIIALATLLPGEDDVGPTCFSLICGYTGGRDAVLNVLLFVPYGFALRLSGVRRSKAIAIATLTTALIESAQLFLVPGRDASGGDVVANLVGSVVGWQLSHSARGWMTPSASGARRLLVTGCFAWIAIASATAWAVQLDLPRTIWFGMWSPELRKFENFRGEVLEASVGSLALRPGQLAKDEPYRTFLLAGAPVIAVVRSGPSPVQVAPIVASFDHEQTEIFVLGRVRDDLVFRIRRHSRQALIGDVTGRLPSAFAGIGESDTVRIGARATAAAMTLWLESDTRRVERRIALDAALGWSLLHPYYLSLGPSLHALSALWLVGLFFPLGFWSALAERRGQNLIRGAIAVISALAMGLYGVSAIAHLSPAPAGVAIGGVIGAALGWASGRKVRRTMAPTRPSGLATPAA